MRADELLEEIEPLSYPDRVRRLVELRRAAGEPALAGLLDELGRGGHYERSTALFVASAVRDEASIAHVLAATRDPDAWIAQQAIRLSVRYAPGPEALLESLLDAPAAIRAATYRAVRKHRRGDLADALVGPVAERWGEHEAAALLPVCTPEVAAGRLGALSHAVPNRHSLGRSHPAAVLEHAERELGGLAEGARAAWWQWHGTGVAAAMPHDPARVVRLLEAYAHTEELPWALHHRVGRLLDAEPERMLELLLANRRWLRSAVRRRSVRDRIARIGGDAPARVARAVRDDGSALRGLLKAVPPSERGALFDAAMRGVDLTAAVHDDALLDVLPRDVRVREARRMLGLRAVADHPLQVRQVTAFLPFEEARPVLIELTRRPDAEERGAGYALLVRCAGRERDPAVLAGLLESLDRLRNEQDPVRLSALNALASVPEGLLGGAHTAAVERFARDALDARDCSWATRRELARLAVAFARQGAARDDGDLTVFGLELLQRVVGHGGGPHLARLDRVLRRGQEHRLVEHLAPLLDRGARRDDHALALTLVRALGRRAHGVPVLQDALERALDATDDRTITGAIALWLEPPATRGARVERVVGKDPSAVRLPAVLAAIAAERTDLLHLVLSPASGGRFQRDDVAYVPRAEPTWTRRWTARQQAAYLRLLERAANDEGAAGSDRGRAVMALAAVPGAGAGRLLPYLESDDAHVRRAALTAAPWTSSPQDVLPGLLARASSDDAHVAVYAAGRAARFVRPSALGPLLRPVLADGKVTARKEALRILLRTRVPDAPAIVAEAWDDPEQHRDVRAAIASALRPYIADPVARRVLAEAARGPRDLARQVLGGWPHEIEERFRAEYADLVVRVAGSPDPEAADAALEVLGRWAPWAPGIPALLADVLTDLDGTRRWRTAMSALLSCVRDGLGAGELSAAAGRLAGATGGADAEAERDLPAAQRLAALASAIRGVAVRHRTAAGPAMEAVAGRLPEPLGLELSAATLDWDSPDAGGALDALADGCAPHGVLAVAGIAEALAGGGEDDLYYDLVPPGVPDAEDVHPHAVRLAERGDLAGGLFACELAGLHGPRAGWPAEWRTLLRGLRAHPDAEVAFAARRIYTADE
ncbi:hypothetical protein [Actinomadura sp. WMMB 499]|uniref:hypothetical protein n=1 Tax=Actinomadura sp. WMMB 499 TaxID=1219491 RepID=UPI0012482A73|nr:hypothetical protein [Actinomadura sp. WMMB 499]QFG20607.1 hypothetical protein F7P10_05040 [Actinomadura sp. WMMB 499]